MSIEKRFEFHVALQLVRFLPRLFYSHEELWFNDFNETNNNLNTVCGAEISTQRPKNYLNQKIHLSAGRREKSV